MQILIPIAGQGLRFKDSDFKNPKPLIDIFGKPMILRALESFQLDANFFFVLKNNEFYEDLRKLLKNQFPNCKIIPVNYYTEGPACSALLAKKYLDFNDDLIITNCDQYIDWDVNDFESALLQSPHDGLVVTYSTDVPHNSYAKIKDNLVLEIKEKEVISNYSLNGVHYWKKALYFIQSAEEMILNLDKSINGEYYIGPTYNYMIQNGYTVGHYNLNKNVHYSLGNVEDLNYFFKNVKL